MTAITFVSRWALLGPARRFRGAGADHPSAKTAPARSARAAKGAPALHTWRRCGLGAGRMTAPLIPTRLHLTTWGLLPVSRPRSATANNMAHDALREEARGHLRKALSERRGDPDRRRFQRPGSRDVRLARPAVLYDTGSQTTECHAGGGAPWASQRRWQPPGPASPRRWVTSGRRWGSPPSRAGQEPWRTSARRRSLRVESRISPGGRDLA